jgi:hypothetical protein
MELFTLVFGTLFTLYLLLRYLHNECAAYLCDPFEHKTIGLTRKSLKMYYRCSNKALKYVLMLFIAGTSMFVYVGCL